MKDPLIGAHTSTAGGLHNALLEASSIKANICQLFTSNQRQWQSRTITADMIELWDRTRYEHGIKAIMSHASYLINLGSCKADLLEKSRKAFCKEIERCHALQIDFLNFHPGAATTDTKKNCLNRIVESLNSFAKLCTKGSTRLLLETTAGQGSVVGDTFEQLAYILENVKNVPLGVCIDTCHIFAAGYDIRTEFAWNSLLQKFDEIIGLKNLYAFHLNDSKQTLGSRIDRHELLGKGKIGIDSFKFLMQNAKTCFLPMYLETPDPSKYALEIAMLKEKYYERQNV